MRPVLDEILRARLPIQPHVLRRWQQTIRESIQPDLDELDALRAAPVATTRRKAEAVTP